MFTNLYFSMVNYLDVETGVSLSPREDQVRFRIDYPKSDRASERGRLGKKASARLLEKISKRGVVEILTKFEDFGLNSSGDKWYVHVVDNDRDLEFSGDKDSYPVLNAVVQDLAEILDEQFSTLFISPLRMDMLEISFVKSELTPELQKHLPEYERCDHTEKLCIDRRSRSISFSRMFPSSCYRMGFDCSCDEEVRSFLDQTGDIFWNEGLFEDIEVEGEGNDAPSVEFRFLHHNGSDVRVKRSLSIPGLQDEQYLEMLDYLSRLLIKVLFKDGLFDKRYILFPGEDRPFFMVYCDEE